MKPITAVIHKLLNRSDIIGNKKPNGMNKIIFRNICMNQKK